MPQQTILLTVLPRAVHVVTATLPVSVVVSPRLTGAATLDAFPDWLEWTARLKAEGLSLSITAGGRTVEASIDPLPLRPDLWGALFLPDTRVDDYVFPDYSDRTVISFPVRDAMLAVKAVYQRAARDLGLPADPRDRESGPRRAATLTRLLEGLQLDEWSDVHRARLRAIYGENVDTLDRPPRSRQAAAPVGADGLPSAAFVEKTPDDARLLKQQVAAQFGLFSRMPPAPPIVKPDMDTLLDFHKVVSALSAYPPLLRALGLVFDLDLPADAVPLTSVATPGRLSVSRVEPGWGEFAVPTDAGPAAETAYLHARVSDGRTFWLTASNEGAERGRAVGLLALDPGAFCLAQFDVDGAMHKLMTLAASVPPSGPHFAPALHPTKLDDAHTLPALRSGGLSLVQDQRARAFLESIRASKRFDDRLNGAADDRPLHAEDLVRGYRLDVWDDFTRTWRSLHLRSGTYAFEGVEFTTLKEEGYTQLAATQPAPDPARPTPNRDLYLHEAVARWGGWSLSVPPPGKALSRSPDPDRAIPPDDPEDRAPDDRQNEPVTPFRLKTTFHVRPRSLPSLRFGRRYRLRARVVDLAGNSLEHDDPLADEMSRVFAIPQDERGFAYLRYEPVPPPQLVRRDDLAIAGPGAALDRLVIRTFNHEPSLDDAAPDRRGCDRHVVPPRASIELAERHGLLDDASGRLKGDGATYALLRDRDDLLGSQFPVAPVPGQTNPLPIVASETVGTLPFVPDPLARAAGLRDLPGAPAHAVGRAAGGALTYARLPDPNPRSGSVTLVDFENSQDWLETRAYLLTLDEGTDPPSWDAARRRLTVFLPKGSTTIVPLSSVPTADDLKLMGVWQWLREYLVDRAGAEQIRYQQDGEQEAIATLLQRLVEGGHWMLTPPTLLTLVSAVQQPIGHPRFEALAVQRANPSTRRQTLSLRTRRFFVGGRLYDPTAEQMESIGAWRAPDGLDAYLVGALRVHGATTAKVDLVARWEEWIDDPRRPEDPPIKEARTGFVDTLPLNDPAQDRVLLAASGSRAVGIYNAEQDLIGFTAGGDVFGRDPALLPEGDAAPRHYLGDMKHRRIAYTAIATSRYREYFPSDPELDFTRSSEPVEVNVPASGRPPLLGVRYVVPTFGWERQSSTNLFRSVRYGGGVRVYLDRPWYASGEGELVGVVLWQAGQPSPAAREAWKLFVTQWGRDPVWSTEPAWPPLPSPEHFPAATIAEDDLRLEEVVPPDENGGPGRVAVAGHEVAFDPDRKLWYCDITLDCPTYNPFVRLALARYQPNALSDAKLSRVVLTDFVQLTPDRSALVAADPYRPTELRLSVTGSAPMGPPPEAPGESPGRPTNVRIRVQRHTAPDRGEFGWADVPDEVARVQAETTVSDAPGILLWNGRVIFAEAPASGAFRLLIEEREYVSADHVATGAIGGASDPRVARAPGRLIYAEIVALDETLTVVPPSSATVAAISEEEPPVGGAGPGTGITAPRFKNQPVLEACLAGTHRMVIGEPATAAVRLVQQALIDRKYKLPRFGPDGVYGQETADAVARFKADRGIVPSDGVVGTKTMRALNTEFENEPQPLPPLRLGVGEMFVEEYALAVKDAEAGHSTDTAEQFLTRLRQMYYPGTNPQGLAVNEAKFDQLMVNAPIREASGKRRLLSASRTGGIPFARLTAAAFENAKPPAPPDNPGPYIVDPEGNKVDVGHVMLTLDALLHDVTGQPYTAFGIPAIDPAWWVADIGIAAVWAEKDGPDAPRVLPKLPSGEADLPGYFEMSAPDADLLGDIDGVSILELWKGLGGPLSDVLIAYYLGSATKPAAFHRRFRTFADLHFGPPSSGPVLFPGMVRPPWIRRIDRLNDLIDAGLSSLTSTPPRRHWPFTDQVFDRFLAFVFTGYNRESALHP